MKELALSIVVFSIILMIFMWDPSTSSSYGGHRRYRAHRGVKCDPIPQLLKSVDKDLQRSMNDRQTDMRTSGKKTNHPNYIKGKWLSSSSQGDDVDSMREGPYAPNYVRAWERSYNEPRIDRFDPTRRNRPRNPPTMSREDWGRDLTKFSDDIAFDPYVGYYYYRGPYKNSIK
jgi:hypothetical protein